MSSVYFLASAGKNRNSCTGDALFQIIKIPNSWRVLLGKINLAASHCLKGRELKIQNTLGNIAANTGSEHSDSPLHLRTHPDYNTAVRFLPFYIYFN